MTARRTARWGLLGVAIGLTGLVGCSAEAPPEPSPGLSSSPVPAPVAEEPPAPTTPAEVPCPRGLKVLSQKTAGSPAQLVAQAVTRTEIMGEVIPYLEYLAAREGLRDGIVYLYDRTPEEAGVPLEPVSYFRFYLGEVVIKSGGGAFVENAEYFKDDEDPTPSGDEIALGHKISLWRVEQGLTALGRERAAAEAYATAHRLDLAATWRAYARVLDDSVSMGKEYFRSRGAEEGQ